MVDNTINEKEKGTRIIIIEAIKKNPRGISITGLVKECARNRTQIRTALAYLLGAGKIQEERASMAKLYYLI